MFTREVVFAWGISALAIGCADQASETQNTIDNLVQAGFSADGIRVVDGAIYVGNDAVVSLEASREILETDSTSTQEQYRTNNLPAPSITTICINGAAFTGAFSTALNTAISRYNALGLSFHMVRTAGSTAGCGATITAHLVPGSGGASGFPSGGLPFNAINIGMDLVSFSLPVIGHVIMHELGHTLGLRHSDFFNHALSCGGTPVNEGAGGIGAILIPGTPATATINGSIMNACFRDTDTDQFSPSDVIALRTLFPPS